MTPSIVLQCPSCGTLLLADDEFCESCGTSLAAERDLPRHHLELDLGRAAGVSDRGLVHHRNEDAFHVEAVGDRVVLVVCDGVSTSAGSQIAAQVAADAAGRALVGGLRGSGGPDGGGWEPAAALESALSEAGNAVRAVPWLGERDASPSCTAVAAVWDGVSLATGWVGDSRAYWIGEEGAEQLTVDHSWAQLQVKAGLMAVEEAEADPRAHAITRWLGADAPEGPEVRVARPTGRGWLVVCSDGLWNEVTGAEALVELVRAQPSPAAIDLARGLVRAALARGGHDNITVVVAEIDAGEPRRAEHEERDDTP